MAAAPTGGVRRVVVVGGGAAGALTAVQLLSRVPPPVEIVLVEPSGELGAGVAYRTDEPAHLLNQPAGAMSALPEQPDDFVEWARARGVEATGSDFLARRVFRFYLGDAVARACRASDDGTTFTVVTDEVTGVECDVAGDGLRLILGGGRALEGDEMVLAIGAPPSAPMRGLGPAEHWSGYLADPWGDGALSAVPAEGAVLLLGTGLTMVDVALVLGGASHPDRLLHARSRHGLLPLGHLGDPCATWPELAAPDCRSAAGLTRAVRREVSRAAAAGWDWRSVVSALRPHVARCWAELPEGDQRRVIRHGLRYWEIHRHRMAPQVAAAIDHLSAEGWLEVGPGRIVGMRPDGRRMRVELSAGGRTEELVVSAVVNCTGPASDYGRSSPLVRHLMAQGRARPHPNGIGLDVDSAGDLVGRHGVADPRLHTVGFCRRGRLLESTAVPEIREQARALADRLAGGDR